MFWIVAEILRPTLYSNELLNGLVILGSLPTSVSMCVVLTTAASGDAAAALFNATALNIIGIFITPLWLLGLLSTSSTVSFGEVVTKLTIKVISPLLLGQLIRYIPHPQVAIQLKVRNESQLVVAMLSIVLFRRKSCC